MAGKDDITSKVAAIPMARPGFDALNMSAPVLVQINPDGKWESAVPEKKDEQRLKNVVQYLVNSKAATAAQSYCSQCAVENQALGGGKSKYVPVIMMPILPADHCPFDMECEIEKMKEAEKKESKRKSKKVDEIENSDKDKTQKKSKKRGFVLQRLTDFDLLSQW